MYDPCAYCYCLESTGRYDGFNETCFGKCLYADKIKENSKKVNRVHDKLECWEWAYACAGDQKTAAIIKNISVSIDAIFGK